MAETCIPEIESEEFIRVLSLLARASFSLASMSTCIVQASSTLSITLSYLPITSICYRGRAHEAWLSTHSGFPNSLTFCQQKSVDDTIRHTPGPFLSRQCVGTTPPSPAWPHIKSRRRFKVLKMLWPKAPKMNHGAPRRKSWTTRDPGTKSLASRAQLQAKNPSTGGVCGCGAPLLRSFTKWFSVFYKLFG